jgi:hypothetical protein
MMPEEEIRKLSNDELFKRHTDASETSINHGALSGEIKRREFIALGATGKIASRVAFLTAGLVLVGLLQAATTYSNNRHQSGVGVSVDRYTMMSVDNHLSILDKQSGAVFIQQPNGWREDQPQSGKFILHKLFDGSSHDPLGIR